MPAPLKLAAFAAGIALIFGGALGVGTAVGSLAPAATAEHDGMPGMNDMTGMDGMDGSGAPVTTMPGR